MGPFNYKLIHLNIAAWANSINLDQTSHSVEIDLGLQFAQNYLSKHLG